MRLIAASFFLACIAFLAQVLPDESTKLRRHSRKRWHERSASYNNDEHYPDDQEDIANDEEGTDEHEGDQVHEGNGPAKEPEPTTPSPCQFHELVQCLSSPLDKWAMLLYSLKENVVAISRDECNRDDRKEIRRCIDEKATELQCTHSDVLTVTRRVTDLLVHKKDSGNWLRSFYVTEYVCSEVGLAMRDSIDDACLKQEHIGETTMEAIKVMDEKLSNNHTAPNKERCDFLRLRADVLKTFVEGRCADHQPAEAGMLMCETVKTTFLKMHPEMFNNGQEVCQFECKHENAAVTNGKEPSTNEEIDNIAQPNANHGQQGGGTEQTTDDNAAHSWLGNWLCLIWAAAMVILGHFQL